ncbi:MAG: hypothetical protein COT39_00770 [Parcubacteria group bacterium CG08_land_8_20_14_0_20_48_21]|nr:MAG: hypothetical protein AUK21_03590 [Parcubacteria group bacterium CG2_30_48_51]PIS33194.1 MAG: hypothetical protein COT39_00770 [Parcubacteria group bacterium CG08_land_8_20_14_0_20_48_21]PIW79437.1 MAG: hypothetical protein COZ99_01295 [Parcubacteria group bacterium CG_4_8_14_3_um_filter_48_16]PIY77698.1 MAG: hypothetical protein COY83_04120 [Parcubacteria group bacterium CG_4_10_14_0_8_um_filter_48_154]PIZ77474.1 MAG: hypothetical protein COY03_02980 [bacterium CG_4_10_14_0_2_um_filter_
MSICTYPRTLYMHDASPKTEFSASDIAKRILRTVLWFDLFQYPVTSFEIWKWLVPENSGNNVHYTLFEIRRELVENPQLVAVLVCEHGCYRLRSADVRSSGRFDAWVVAEKKYRKAKRFVRIFSLLPFVQGIAICNSLGYRNARENDDIDLFILASPGRLWLTRFFVTGVLALLRQRPTSLHAKNKLCPSFFLSGIHLDLHAYALADDLYLRYWVTQLTPLINRQNIFSRFQSYNAWAEPPVPTIGGGERYHRSQRFFSLLEYVCKRWQLGRLPEKLRLMAKNPQTHVVITDTILKFHDQDRRAAYRDAWHAQCNAHGVD